MSGKGEAQQAYMLTRDTLPPAKKRFGPDQVAAFLLVPPQLIDGPKSPYHPSEEKIPASLTNGTVNSCLKKLTMAVRKAGSSAVAHLVRNSTLRQNAHILYIALKPSTWAPSLRPLTPQLNEQEMAMVLARMLVVKDITAINYRSFGTRSGNVKAAAWRNRGAAWTAKSGQPKGSKQQRQSSKSFPPRRGIGQQRHKRQQSGRWSRKRVVV